MNTDKHYQLIPAEPILERLNAYGQRLANLENENQQLRHQQPEQRHTTRDGACIQLGIRYTKLHSLINDGYLNTVKIGRRTLITQESIDRYLAHASAKK